MCWRVRLSVAGVVAVTAIVSSASTSFAQEPGGAPAPPAPPSDKAAPTPPSDKPPEDAPPSDKPAEPPPQAPPPVQPQQPQQSDQPPTTPAGEQVPLEPPATAPQPVQPLPAVPPQRPQSVASVPGADIGVRPDEPTLPPFETTLGPEVFGGLNYRLGGHESLDADEPVGITFGLGAWLAPSRLFSLGLSYQRTGLGAGESAPAANSISARYDLNTIWLGGRAYPWRSDRLGLFVGLGLGASWQDVSANGTRQTDSFTTPARVFSCAGSDGPNIALGGGLGVDVDIDRNLAFIAGVDASGHQLTSDVVDSCALGAGSATNLSGRLAFSYRFDLEPIVGSTSRTATARF